MLLGYPDASFELKADSDSGLLCKEKVDQIQNTFSYDLKLWFSRSWQWLSIFPLLSSTILCYFEKAVPLGFLKSPCIASCQVTYYSVFFVIFVDFKVAVSRDCWHFFAWKDSTWTPCEQNKNGFAKVLVFAKIFDRKTRKVRLQAVLVSTESTFFDKLVH